LRDSHSGAFALSISAAMPLVAEHEERIDLLDLSFAIVFSNVLDPQTSLQGAGRSRLTVIRLTP
jgi:hypothetical protein